MRNHTLLSLSVALVVLGRLLGSAAAADERPNIIYIMSDDHAAQAIGCYGSKINQTPNLDRLAQEGMRFANCFCTNSICGPSRAVIKHYGERTDRYKLIYFHELGEWELFDLQKDPHEMTSVYSDPAYAHVVRQLKAELERLKKSYKDDDAVAVGR
jgi:arylsulfatase A-like enzyme